MALDQFTGPLRADIKKKETPIRSNTQQESASPKPVTVQDQRSVDFRRIATAESNFKKSQDNISTLQKNISDIERNRKAPFSTKVSKALGDGVVGSIAGGITGLIERPARYLLGSGYQVATAFKAGTGNEQAQRDIRNAVNPYLSERDTRIISNTNVTPKSQFDIARLGTQRGLDASQLLTPTMPTIKGASLVGASEGVMSALAEDDVTAGNVLTSGVTGLITGGLLKSAGKGFQKLRSTGNKTLSRASNLIDDAQAKAPEIDGSITTIRNNIDSRNFKLPKVGRFENDISNATKFRKGFKEALKDYGDLGKTLSRNIDRFENAVNVKVATSMNKFSKVWNSLDDKTNSNTKVIQYILDVYNNKTPSVNLTDKERIVANSFFNDVTKEVSEEAKVLNIGPAGKKIGKAREFIPLVIKDFDKWKNAHINKLIRDGKVASVEEAEKELNKIFGTIKVGDDIRGIRFPGLENPRFFEPQNFQDLVDFGYEYDLTKIANKYSRGAWRRVQAEKILGAKGGKELDNLFNKMIQEGYDNADVTKLRETFNSYLNGRPLSNESIESAVSILKSLGLTRLGFSSGLKQPISLSQSIAVARPKNLIKAIGSLLDETSRKRVGNIISNSGAILDDRFDEIKLLRSDDVELSGGVLANVAKVMRKFTSAKIKLTGIQKLDGAMRRMSGYMGYEWITDSMRKLASQDLDSATSRRLLKELQEFAIPDESEIINIVSNGGNMTDEQIARAINQFSTKTQFGASKAEIPGFFINSAYGELWGSLRTYAFEQAQFVERLIRNRMWDSLATYAVAVLGIAYPIEKVIDTMKGNDDSEKKRILDAMATQMLGIYYDSLVYGTSSYPRLGVFIGVGPAEAYNLSSTAIRTGERIVQGKKDPFKPVKSYTNKQLKATIPFYQRND